MAGDRLTFTVEDIRSGIPLLLYILVIIPSTICHSPAVYEK